MRTSSSVGLSALWRNRVCWHRAALVALAVAGSCVAGAGCDEEETSVASPTTTTAQGGAGGGSGGAGAAGAAGGTGGAGATGGGGSGGSGPPVVRLPRESILPEELAILVNTADAQSVAVGAYYQNARGIPAANLVELTIPTGPVLSQADFATAKAAVDAALGPDIQAIALSWTHPYRVDCMSVTTAFALGFDSSFCSTPCNPTAPVDYFGSESLEPFTDHGLRPTMMLAAASTEDAMALIDRGVASDQTFPLGSGFLVRTTDTARSVRWPAFTETVSDWDYAGGLELSYLDNAAGTGLNYIENETDVLFYFTGLVQVPAIETNTYRPGAVADHLTSVGGEVPTSGQMSVVAWLQAGVTASYGTVVEPCNFTQKFPSTLEMLPHYFRGETVLEAYWKSVQWPGEGLFVGEPLARPWGSAVDFADGALTIRTTTLLPGQRYELRAAESEAGPYVAVLTDIEVTALQIATITLENAGAPFYELAPEGI